MSKSAADIIAQARKKGEPQLHFQYGESSMDPNLVETFKVELPPWKNIPRSFDLIPLKLGIIIKSGWARQVLWTGMHCSPAKKIKK